MLLHSLNKGRKRLLKDIFTLCLQFQIIYNAEEMPTTSGRQSIKEKQHMIGNNIQT